MRVFREVSERFQRGFREFSGSFQGVFREFSGSFQGGAREFSGRQQGLSGNHVVADAKLLKLLKLLKFPLAPQARATLSAHCKFPVGIERVVRSLARAKG